MLHSDDDDKEDRWEKLPAAVVPSDCREMGEGEEVKARWNKWVMPKGDEDDSGEEHAGLQWKVWPEPIHPVGDESIGLHVIVFTALTSSSSSSSCMPQPGRQKRSPPPRRTCVSAITKWARQVAWLESSNCEQAWGTGLCGRASGKPWLLRKVTHCTAQCATTSSNSRPSYLGRENGGSAAWWTAASSERPTTAPGIFSVT